MSKSATKAAARSGWLRRNRVIPRFCRRRIGTATAFVADLDTVRGSGVRGPIRARCRVTERALGRGLRGA